MITMNMKVMKMMMLLTLIDMMSLSIKVDDDADDETMIKVNGSTGFS